MKKGMRERVAKFQKAMAANGIDAAFISGLSNPDTNIGYFTGIEVDSGFLIIPKKGNSKLLVSKMEYARAYRSVRHMQVIMFKKPIAEQICRIVRTARTIGINKGVMAVGEYEMLKKALKKMRFADIRRMLLEQRSVKSAKEISLIKEACRISDRIFHDTFRNMHRFRTEQDIRHFMADETRKRGHKTSFEPLVASGNNSGLVHYLGSDVKLKRGFCFIDFGVDVDGYKSDTTRTVFVGRPAAKELELYALLLDVQEKAIRMVRPGVRCSDIDKAVRRWLGRYEDNFTHSLGHGVGLQIHELPNLNPESKDTLEPGMVLTIEPGIYFPGKMGIRIEDTVLVTEKGYKVLTGIGKDLMLTKEVKR